MEFPFTDQLSSLLKSLKSSWSVDADLWDTFFGELSKDENAEIRDDFLLSSYWMNYYHLPVTFREAVDACEAAMRHGCCQQEAAMLLWTLYRWPQHFDEVVGPTIDSAWALARQLTDLDDKEEIIACIHALMQAILGPERQITGVDFVNRLGEDKYSFNLPWERPRSLPVLSEGTSGWIQTRRHSMICPSGELGLSADILWPRSSLHALAILLACRDHQRSLLREHLVSECEERLCKECGQSAVSILVRDFPDTTANGCTHCGALSNEQIILEGVVVPEIFGELFRMAELTVTAELDCAELRFFSTRPTCVPIARVSEDLCSQFFKFADENIVPRMEEVPTGPFESHVRLDILSRAPDLSVIKADLTGVLAGGEESFRAAYSDYLRDWATNM